MWSGAWRPRRFKQAPRYDQTGSDLRQRPHFWIHGAHSGVLRDPSRSGDLSFAGSEEQPIACCGMARTAHPYFSDSHGRAGTGRTPYSLGKDSVQDFRFNTNGLQRQSGGGAGGGVINVITKSGSKRFHGSAFDLSRKGAQRARILGEQSQHPFRRSAHITLISLRNIGRTSGEKQSVLLLRTIGQGNTTLTP